MWELPTTLDWRSIDCFNFCNKNFIGFVFSATQSAIVHDADAGDGDGAGAGAGPAGRSVGAQMAP